MKAWGVSTALLLACLLVGCGGNSTKVGITITSVGNSPLTVLVNSTVQFSATITGVSATTVYWQVCKETVSPPSTINPPTDCTLGQGPPQCKVPKVSSPLTGYGIINATGVYTAPASPPQPDTILIVATSCVDSTAFATFTVNIDSGIRVTVVPSSVTLATGESYQFTANVTPNTNPGVSWQVCQAPTTASGSPTNCATDNSNGLGSINASGLYTAPNSGAGGLVVATSSADPTKFGTATVDVTAAANPTLTGIQPLFATQGSVQQDVYITGTSFLTSSTVTVGGVALPAANVFVLSSTLMRVTIPAAQLAQAGAVPITVQTEVGNSSGSLSLTINPEPAAVVSATPDSLLQNNSATPNVILTGGYFTTALTTATFNNQSVPATVSSSRQLFLSVPSGSLSTPGLYPIVVQNAGTTGEAALNLAVTPTTLSGAASAPISVGSGPAAVAVDEADGIAVVANSSSNTVTLIDLATDSVVGAPIAVGNDPTGVAVDDMLPNHMAYVVNSADNSVSAINLSLATPIVTETLELGPYAPSLIPVATVPYSIGVNPLTHRALITNQSTNIATILDLVNANPSLMPACNAAPCPIGTVGAGNTPYSTGLSPAVAIDPTLNWAVVTPGGAGTVSIVDLGMDANPVTGQLPRSPQIIGSITISETVQGVGINTETHTALLTDPTNSLVETFNMLDGTVTDATYQGTEFTLHGAGAAGVSSLENVGVAVSGTTQTAAIVNMDTGVVLQTVSNLGASPAGTQSVAVDPVTNQAVVVNESNGSVSIISLGPALDPLQIVEASPSIIFGPTTSDVPITITGSGFGGGSQVTLDGTAIPTTSVSPGGRQMIASIPESMLAGARHYSVQVQNAGGVVSNVEGLTVVQPIAVGTAPVGVAIDQSRDLAVVSNSGDGTATLVALTPQTPVGMSQSPAGTVGAVATITAGNTPVGVATDFRLGLAVVANNGSNNATVIDVTQTNVPVNVALCSAEAANCNNPAGLAIDPDSGTTVVADTNPSATPTPGAISLFTLPASATTVADAVTVDQDPVTVAVDNNPAFPYAAVGTASTSSSVDFVDYNTEVSIGRVSGLSNPSGIVFDPVNQDFIVANSLENEIVIIDPSTLTPVAERVGMGPTSLDYNFQTSTLVTNNSGSDTMSVMAYSCPPSGAVPATTCFTPQVKTVLGLGGTQTTVQPLGANAVAIDLKLNLAVLVDEDNNRVLLVPLPY